MFMNGGKEPLFIDYKAGEQKTYAWERLHMVGLYPSPAHRPLRGVPGK